MNNEEQYKIPSIGDYIAISQNDINHGGYSDIKKIYKISEIENKSGHINIVLQYEIDKQLYSYGIQLRKDELFKFMISKTKEEIEIMLNAKKYNIL